MFQSQVALVQARRDQIVASYRLKAAIGELTVVGIDLPVEPYNPEAYYLDVRNRLIGLGKSLNADVTVWLRASGPARRSATRSLEVET